MCYDPRMVRALKGHLTSAGLFDILRTRTRRSSKKIDKELEDRCTENLAVLMADSSGFTRIAHKHGILQFLATMTQAYDRVIPILTSRGGTCISHNADNILGVFDEPEMAVAAAIAMHRHLRRHNRSLPEKEQFNICIGINYGAVLRLSDNIYGDAVNIAAKLGEDLAAKDEILITRPAHDRLGGRFKSRYNRSTEIGGRTLELFKVSY